MAENEPLKILAPASQVPTIARNLNRRRFLSFAAAAGGAGVLAACTPGGAESSAPQATGGELEDSLSIYTWGDYDDPGVIENFTTELGPTITLDSYNSNEELVSKLIAANGTSGYDIIVPTGPFIPQMIENGLFTPLNLDLIPNIEHVDPEFLGLAWDPENEYSICKAWGTTGFVYDTTVIDRELTTWADFLDAAQNEASGSVSMLDDPIAIAGAYLWSIGESQSTTDEALLAEAEDYMVNNIAPHISTFESYPGGTIIPTNAAALVQTWNGDARLGILESADPDRWKWVLPAPTTEIWMDNWAIAAGAPHPEAAHAFINYVLTPENSLLELDYIGYNTGGAGIEAAAEEYGVELPELIFFTSDQLATMQETTINEAQQTIVDIWNKTKVAAGA